MSGQSGCNALHHNQASDYLFTSLSNGLLINSNLILNFSNQPMIHVWITGVNSEHTIDLFMSQVLSVGHIFEPGVYSTFPAKYASGKSLHPRVSLWCPASRHPRKTLRKASLLKSLSSFSDVFAYSKQLIHPGKVMKYEYHMDHKSFAF